LSKGKLHPLNPDYIAVYIYIYIYIYRKMPFPTEPLIPFVAMAGTLLAVRLAYKYGERYLLNEGKVSQQNIYP
jgi:hypothetical protein